MIHFVEHKNIDKKKWDDCIDKSFNHSVSAYSWYMDTVCKSWSAIILDDYKAVFPLPIKSKYKIKYLLQPLFIRSLSIYSKQMLSETLVNNFFDAIPTSIKLFDFHLQENISFKRNDLKVIQRKFQILDLGCSYEELIKNYDKDIKRSIKKAEKAELNVSENVTPNEIVILFKNSKGRELKNLTPDDFILLENLMNICLKHNNGIMRAVHNNQKQLVAAGFFIKNDNRILYLQGCSSQDGKSQGAMYLLLNNLFKEYASQRQIVFDFGGSDIEGIANFNRNFGAKDCVYLQVKKNTLPSVVKWVSGK